MNRREFLRRGGLSVLAGGAALTGAKAMAAPDPGAKVGASARVGTVIDLTKCDGCADRGSPACVTSCREENAHRFPEPREEDLKPYWPQKRLEDWSKRRHVVDRLTPYNWTMVQRVEVEHEGQKATVNVPRRCMHCDDPPCARLCPFGANEKTPQGPVVIDDSICMGGAKCRSVCPWEIPARQAGVGLYLKLAPTLAGGGVMYKCDLCHDRIVAGGRPACVEACPRGAISFGSKEEMRRLARARAAEIGGHVYGDDENGGTSTFYVSAVPFEAIHRALDAKRRASPNPDAPGFPLMPVGVENYLDTANGLAASLLVAPVAGVIAAGAAVYRGMTGQRSRGSGGGGPPKAVGEGPPLVAIGGGQGAPQAATVELGAGAPPEAPVEGDTGGEQGAPADRAPVERKED
jgi:formate dehydrogenase iron-sulfur subunit